MVAVLEKGCGTEARNDAFRILVVQGREAAKFGHADMAKGLPEILDLSAAPTLDGALRSVRGQRYDAILLDVDAAAPYGAGTSSGRRCRLEWGRRSSPVRGFSTP